MPTAPKTFRMYDTAPRKNTKSPEAYDRSRKYRTKRWSWIRDQVMARDMMVCQICGQFVIGKGQAHVDHIVPVANGGSDDMDNLRLLHASCHSRRTIQSQRGKE